jgi:hypothetical protein
LTKQQHLALGRFLVNQAFIQVLFHTRSKNT